MRAAKTIAGLAAAILWTAVAPAGADILPVGTWTFNEGKGTTAYDFSGHRNNGRLEGLAQWTQGRFQGGLGFNGNAAAVDVSNSPSLEPAAVSVSAWVDGSESPGDFKYILAKGANGCLAASYGLYTGANGGLEFYVSSNQGMSWTLSPDAGRGVWNGQWHNVVGTYDGSSVRLYVDGHQVGSGTPDTAPIAYGLPTSNDLLIGDYPGGCSNLDFSGSIDEVKIFNRALGSQEIGLGAQLSRLLPSSFPFDLIL
jgi:Concanavalin A-like lectin/glucanases superfamily